MRPRERSSEVATFLILRLLECSVLRSPSGLDTFLSAPTPSLQTDLALEISLPTPSLQRVRKQTCLH